jgi:hypothetical protein
MVANKTAGQMINIFKELSAMLMTLSLIRGNLGVAQKMLPREDLRF